MNVVAGADVAVDGEAQRAAAVGRRVEGGVAGVELAAAAVAAGARAHAVVIDGAGLQTGDLDAVDVGGEAVGIANAQRERLQRRQLGADGEVPADEARAGTARQPAVAGLDLERSAAVAPLDQRRPRVPAAIVELGALPAR